MIMPLWFVLISVLFLVSCFHMYIVTYKYIDIQVLNKVFHPSNELSVSSTDWDIPGHATLAVITGTIIIDDEAPVDFIFMTGHQIDAQQLTHILLDKMAVTSQLVLSDAFLWMKSFVVWSKFQRSLFPRFHLTIT